jgi:predicted phosphoribosyltransferase
VHRAWRKLYTESHPPVDPAGQIAIIVDDRIEVTDDMVVAALSRRTLAQRAS